MTYRALTTLISLMSAPAISAQQDIALSIQSFDDVRLAGTLYLPEGNPPFPVTVIVHGSERGHRANRGYQSWVERFRQAGLGVFVWDKRGVGESGGSYMEAPDLHIPARDVADWVALLATRQDVDPDRLGVMGWSQGGWIGPLAASRSGGIKYVVSISGPGVSPLRQNIYDKTNRLRLEGVTPAQASAGSLAVRLTMTYLATGENRDSAETAWEAVSGEQWFEESYRGIPMLDRESALSDERFQQFVVHNRYQPFPVLASLDVPLLAVFGSADRIVPVAASIRAFRTAFEQSGNPGLTVRVFEGADHGIGIRANGQRALAPDYVETVLQWINER